jgi:MFS family permease
METMWTIGAIISGVICAFMASKKNRSEFGWLLVGFLIGIFGLILLYILDPLPGATQTVRTISRVPEKKCPMCAETVKSEARLCRFCGHKFENFFAVTTE